MEKVIIVRKIQGKLFVDLAHEPMTAQANYRENMSTKIESIGLHPSPPPPTPHSSTPPLLSFYRHFPTELLPIRSWDQP